MKIDRTGEKYITNEGCKICIIKYYSAKNSTIEFEDGHIKYNVTFKNIKEGNIKNPYHKSVFGVGFLAEGKYKAYIDNAQTLEYKIWTSMLNRCYGTQYKSYKDVKVCEEWYNFQNFAEWVKNNYRDCMCDWHLDKDILSKEYKIYSPETCAFVPREVNILFLTSSKTNKLPMGVHKDKKAYSAKCWIMGKYTNLGNYNTVEEAFEVYQFNKLKEIKRVADKWKNKIDPRIYNAMYSKS